MKDIKNNITKWMYWFLFAISVIAVYKLLDNFAIITQSIGKFINVIAPVLGGLLIAYILYIPASRIEKVFKKSKNKLLKKNARKLGALFAYIIAILVIVIIINLILPTVISSIIELVNNFQGYYQTFLDEISKLPEDSFWKSEQVKSILSSIQQMDISKIINIDTIMQYAKGAISLVTGLVDIFVMIVVSAYALLERGKLLSFARGLTSAIFNEELCQKIGKYFNDSNKIFYKFLSSQILDAVIVGILATIVMSILKVEYAVLLGFMVGLFNIIPYFGAIVGVAIAILLTLITGGISQAIWMGVSVTILQQIDANIINPKIVGNSLEISPLLIIFSVTVGGAYFGVLGMFLAVPVAAVLKILINDYIVYKNRKKRLSN
jgi:predicted PurR-regulated permease PerM